jgi:hypothetical protein
MFPDWPPGARTANSTALCHQVQLYHYFVSLSSEFYCHNPLCCFSISVYCCKRIFHYRLRPETFGYTLVFKNDGKCLNTQSVKWQAKDHTVWVKLLVWVLGFFSVIISRLTLGPIQPPLQWVLVDLSTRVQQSQNEANHRLHLLVMLRMFVGLFPHPYMQINLPFTVPVYLKDRRDQVFPWMW